MSLVSGQSTLAQVKAAAQDVDMLVANPKYRTPCLLLRAGTLHSMIGEKQRAKGYYDDAITLATSQISAGEEKAVLILCAWGSVRRWRSNP